MGTPAKLNKIMKRELVANVAWIPIANTFALGDYGLFQGGVFQKLGNIAEYGVEGTPVDSPDVSLDFASSSTKVARFVGGMGVNVIPQGVTDAEAEIRFGFEKERSFLLKAATVHVEETQDVQRIANELAAQDAWRHKWWVVRKTFRAHDAAVYSTLTANTTLTVHGRADALKAFEIGDVRLGVDVSTDKELGLEFTGAEGVVALNLFRVRAHGGPRLLGRAAGSDAAYDPDAPDLPNDEV